MIKQTIKSRLLLLINERFKGNSSNMARELGVKPPIITKWTNDISEPSAKHLTNINKKLSVNINWLLTGEGEKYMQSSIPVKYAMVAGTTTTYLPPDKVLVKDEKGTHSLITRDEKDFLDAWRNVKPGVKEGIRATIEANRDPGIVFETVSEVNDKAIRFGKDALTLSELYVLAGDCDQIISDPSETQLHEEALKTSIDVLRVIRVREGKLKRKKAG